MSSADCKLEMQHVRALSRDRHSVFARDRIQVQFQVGKAN